MANYSSELVNRLPILFFFVFVNHYKYDDVVSSHIAINCRLLLFCSFWPHLCDLLCSCPLFWQFFFLIYILQIWPLHVFLSMPFFQSTSECWTLFLFIIQANILMSILPLIENDSREARIICEQTYLQIYIYINIRSMHSV